MSSCKGKDFCSELLTCLHLTSSQRRDWCLWFGKFKMKFPDISSTSNLESLSLAKSTSHTHTHTHTHSCPSQGLSSTKTDYFSWLQLVLCPSPSTPLSLSLSLSLCLSLSLSLVDPLIPLSFSLSPPPPPLIEDSGSAEPRPCDWCLIQASIFMPLWANYSGWFGPWSEDKWPGGVDMDTLDYKALCCPTHTHTNTHTHTSQQTTNHSAPCDTVKNVVPVSGVLYRVPACTAPSPVAFCSNKESPFSPPTSKWGMKEEEEEEEE